jgi:nucleoside-diphosphate-sugar epimerase
MQLMEANARQLRHRNSFNISAMNFTPEGLVAEIRKHIPEFVIDYEVDPIRQAIADSWPRSVDDSAARAEWGWVPAYDVSAMTKHMLEKLGKKLKPAR